jgi:hypothetical protein
MAERVLTDRDKEVRSGTEIFLIKVNGAKGKE